MCPLGASAHRTSFFFPLCSDDVFLSCAAASELRREPARDLRLLQFHREKLKTSRQKEHRAWNGTELVTEQQQKLRPAIPPEHLLRSSSYQRGSRWTPSLNHCCGVRGGDRPLQAQHLELFILLYCTRQSLGSIMKRGSSVVGSGSERLLHVWQIGSAVRHSDVWETSGCFFKLKQLFDEQKKTFSHVSWPSSLLQFMFCAYCHIFKSLLEFCYRQVTPYWDYWGEGQGRFRSQFDTTSQVQV